MVEARDYLRATRIHAVSPDALPIAQNIRLISVILGAVETL